MPKPSGHQHFSPPESHLPKDRVSSVLGLSREPESKRCLSLSKSQTPAMTDRQHRDVIPDKWQTLIITIHIRQLRGEKKLDFQAPFQESIKSLHSYDTATLGECGFSMKDLCGEPLPPPDSHGSSTWCALNEKCLHRTAVFLGRLQAVGKEAAEE